MEENITDDYIIRFGFMINDNNYTLWGSELHSFFSNDFGVDCGVRAFKYRLFCKTSSDPAYFFKISSFQSY